MIGPKKFTSIIQRKLQEHQERRGQCLSQCERVPFLFSRLPRR
ncbi:hypothetical protein AAZX31_07G191300 [Glycine max]